MTSAATAHSRQEFTWTRVDRYHTCPVCGNHDWCEVGSDKITVHCMRQPGPRQTEYRGGGYIHSLLKPVDWVSDEVNTPASKSAPLPVDVLDKMNRRIIELLPVNPSDRKYLETTPLNPDKCGSYQRSVAVRVGSQIAAEFGSDYADRHPYLKCVYDAKLERWIYKLIPHYNGILIPVENERTGHLLGIQIRSENTTSKKTHDYFWISEAGRGGAPFGVKYAPGSSLVIITEGRKKAEALATHFKCHVIYFAGVSAYDRNELLKELKNLHPTRAAVAYDQDKHRNKAVHDQELRLIRLLQKELPALELLTVEWDRQYKGADDALKAGVVLQFEPIKKEKPSKLVTDLPLTELTKTFGQQMRKVYTLDEAHSAHEALARRTLLSSEPVHIVNDSLTGAGKSTAWDNAVATLAMEGKLKIWRTKTRKDGSSYKVLDNKRVLIACPDKANVMERTRPGTLLHKLIQSGIARVQLGRQPNYDGQNPATDYDCHNPQARSAGEANHVPAQAVCASCPFGSEDNWREAFGDKPMPWNCQKEGFIHSRRLSREAQIVIATKEAYLNDSKEIEEFDVKILDEKLLPILIKTFVISRDVLTGWRNRLALWKASNQNQTMTQEDDWRLLFDTVEMTLANLPALYVQEKRPTALLPVMDVLKETALKLGAGGITRSFETWINGILEPAPTQSGIDAYQFEKPYEEKQQPFQFGPRTLKFPLRAGYILLEALCTGEAAVKARPNEDGTFSLVIHQVDRKLVNRLEATTLVVLDATPPPLLFKLFPDMQAVSFDVTQHLQVSQITNALYTKRDLENERTRATVEKAIARYFEGAANPLLLLPKRYEEGEKAIQAPAGARVGHWGKDDRATNQYEECDRLVLIGHPERPLDYIQAEVDAVKSYLGEKATASATTRPPDKLRLYNHVLPSGMVAGRYCSTHHDPDVQAAIEFDYYAFIIQAIGRLRAAKRSADNPSHVLIMCAEPAGNLRINDLTTTDRLLKEGYQPKVQRQDEGFSLYINSENETSTLCTFPQEVEIPTVIPQEPQEAQPRHFYYAMLDNQDAPEGIENVSGRINSASSLTPAQRKALLEYARRRRESLKEAMAC